MLKRLLVVAGFAVAMAFSTGVAHADQISGYTTAQGGCPGCPAATYTLTVTGTPSEFASGTGLTVTLTVSTDPGATITSGTSYISAVAFNLAEGSGLSAASLYSTSGISGSLTDWSTNISQNASNGNCSGNGSGWVCSDVTSSGAWTDAAVTTGGSLSWTWNNVDIGGALNMDPTTWSLQVKYNNDTGTKNGVLISESPTGVPEPGTLVLLGTGLIPLLGFGRRFLS